MPQYHVKNNFTSGELSQKMDARTDFDKYNNGLKTLENCHALVQGGATRRNGFRFVNEVKTSTLYTRLVDFQFSTLQAYILEFGNLYIRIYRNGGRVESPPGTPVEVVTPYLTAELPALVYAQSADTLYIASQNHPPAKLTRTSDTSWSLANISFNDGPYQVANPSGSFTLTCSATTGTVTLTAAGFTPFTADSVGSIYRIFGAGGSAWGWGIVTAYTDSTHVTFAIQQPMHDTNPQTNWRAGYWGTVPNAQGVALANGWPGSVTFTEQRLAWSGSPGFPATIWASRSSDYENHQPGVGLGQSPTIVDSDPYIFTVASNKVNAIKSMQQGRQLILGTIAEEYSMAGTGSTGYISPNSVKIRPESAYGSAATVQPVKIGYNGIYVQRSGKKIRRLYYDYIKDAYLGDDLTKLSDHVTTSGVQAMTYEQEPYSLLWAVRNDGLLTSLTYWLEENVIGWSRHPLTNNASVSSIATIPNQATTADQTWGIINIPIGGTVKRYVAYSDPTLSTDLALTYDGTNITYTCAPAATTGQDVIFTASGASFTSADVGKDIVPIGSTTLPTPRATIISYTDTTHVHARILNAFPSTSAMAAATWGLAVSSVSGLSHLEGVPVKVLGDGGVCTDQTVTSGVVSVLPQKALKVEVGMQFIPKITTLTPEFQDKRGSIQGRPKQWAEVYVRVMNTTGMTINGIPWAVRTSNDLMSTAIVPDQNDTVDYVVNPANVDRKARVTISQPNPLPFTVLAIYGLLDVGD